MSRVTLIKEADPATDRTPLSVVILTSNSQKYLRQVLESVKFADEVVIYDQKSRDKTLEIASQYSNTTIYIDPDWQGFGVRKQKAVEKARNRWVFVLDSDEIVTSPLREEILSLLPTPPKASYFVPRLNYFFGKWVEYGGFYPDYSIRFFDKTRCQFDTRRVHEKVKCHPKDIGYLSGDICHFAYETISQFIGKQNRYSDTGAKPSKIKAVIAPIWTFFKIYFLRLGFLEGWVGFLLATLYSQYTFWKYAKGTEAKTSPKLPEKYRQKKAIPAGDISTGSHLPTGEKSISPDSLSKSESDTSQNSPTSTPAPSPLEKRSGEEKGESSAPLSSNSSSPPEELNTAPIGSPQKRQRETDLEGKGDTTGVDLNSNSTPGKKGKFSSSTSTTGGKN